MQIHCHHCTKTLLLPADGALPAECPHCHEAPGPGVLGCYEPVRLLAAGGMGEVYLARHTELGTEVAIKLLRPMPLDQLPGLRERFAREARLAAQVAHPGVVRVLASELADDRPYLVLELVRGRTLRALLADGPATVAEALRLAVATAEVLAEAHAHGVLHRDVKPDNVMVQDDGRVRVLDFGIARAIADDAPLTRTGELVGTPEYMAPEQLLDGPEAVDARTDVHAVGVLTYELLTGRSPFRGSSLFQSLKLVESLVPPPPSSLRAEVPTAIDEIVRQALRKDPRQRPADAGAFAAALRAAMPSPPPTPTPRASRSPGWSRLAIGLVLLGGAVSLTAWLRPTVVPEPSFAAPTAEQQRTAERAAILELLAAGRWQRALHRAERLLADGDAAARPLAQHAFARQHSAWVHALGLPAWLGACDESERRRLFVADVEHATRSTDGLPDGFDPAGAEPVPALLRQLPRDDDGLADALLAHAQRLPIDEPEHWLAQLVVRHRRGDAAGRERAAEQAWLRGAGELAVLLDAGAALLPLAANGALGPAPEAAVFRRLRRRVLAANASDAPAAVLLLTWMAAIADETPELPALRSLPKPFVPAASAWLTTTAAQEPSLRDQLLLATVALGAQPDFRQRPWSSVPAGRRPVLEAEANRGR